MKTRHGALLTGIFLCAALLITGCGKDDPETEQVVPAPTGKDWRSLRGYSSESYTLFGQEVLISLIHGEDALGYSFYDATYGDYSGKLMLDTSVWTFEDMDEERLWTLYEADFNEDGVHEFGVPMRDGVVLWYEYVMPAGFCFYGSGNAEGPDEPFPPRVGAGLSEVCVLEDGTGVRFSYYQSESEAGYYVLDETGDLFYGTLDITLSTGGYGPDAVERSGETGIRTDDLDGDGDTEFGVPIRNGSTLWYTYDEEESDFVFCIEEYGAPEEEAAFSVLMEMLGEQMEGKTVTAMGSAWVNGLPCQLFSYGTDTPEKFTAEKHFAVDGAGQVYVMDVLNGADFLPYQP